MTSFFSSETCADLNMTGIRLEEIALTWHKWIKRLLILSTIIEIDDQVRKNGPDKDIHFLIDINHY